MPQYQTTAKGKRVEPGDTEYNWDKESTSFDPVGEARYTLGKGRQMMAGPQAEGEAAATEAQQPYQPPTPGFRGVTDSLERDSVYPGLASIAPPLRPLSALAGGMLIPGGVRKLVNPDEDESRWGGAGQLGFAALSMIGLKGRGAKPALDRPMSTEFRPTGFKPQSTPVEGYGGVGQNASGLNSPSLRELENIVSQGQPHVPTGGLPESWKQFASLASPKVAKSLAKSTPLGAKGRLSRMEQESGAGYRNVPPESNNPMLDTLPEGGMGSITPTEWSKLGLRQVQDDIPRHLDEAANWGEDLLSQLSRREGRLGIPERARNFRTNTPTE